MYVKRYGVQRMINIAIVDDEQIYLDKIEDKIRKYMSVEKVQIDKYLAPEQFLNSNRQYQVVFLDIMLNTSIDGLNVAEKYKFINNNALIILVSSLKECLSAGYRVDASWSIVKDSEKEDEEYEGAINKVRNILLQREKRVEFDTISAGILSIPAYSIKYLKNVMRNIEVHTIDDVFVAKGTVKQYVNELEEKGFVCSHSSYLVNLAYIEVIDGEDIVLKSNERVAISRLRKKQVEEKIILYKARYEVR